MPVFPPQVLLLGARISSRQTGTLQWYIPPAKHVCTRPWPSPARQPAPLQGRQFHLTTIRRPEGLDTEPLMFYTGRRFQQDNEYREFLRRAGTGVRRFRVMHVDG